MESGLMLVSRLSSAGSIALAVLAVVMSALTFATYPSSSTSLLSTYVAQCEQPGYFMDNAGVCEQSFFAQIWPALFTVTILLACLNFNSGIPGSARNIDASVSGMAAKAGYGFALFLCCILTITCIYLGFSPYFSSLQNLFETEVAVVNPDFVRYLTCSGASGCFMNSKSSSDDPRAVFKVVTHTF
jgi:hypothetical protein